MGIVKDNISLKFEVNIKEARNVEHKSSPTTLFVRFYLHADAGNNNKIELNTKEICSRSDHEVVTWNQSFGLECQGDKATVDKLKQQNVVFELRQRKTTPFFKEFSRSKVIGKGEISWKSVLDDSDDMETERFVVMNHESKNRILQDCNNNKPLMLKIALKVQASRLVNNNNNKKVVKDLCECRDCNKRCNCLDYEAFVVACALDVI